MAVMIERLGHRVSAQLPYISQSLPQLWAANKDKNLVRSAVIVLVTRIVQVHDGIPVSPLCDLTNRR